MDHFTEFQGGFVKLKKKKQSNYVSLDNEQYICKINKCKYFVSVHQCISRYFVLEDI